MCIQIYLFIYTYTDVYMYIYVYTYVFSKIQRNMRFKNKVAIHLSTFSNLHINTWRAAMLQARLCTLPPPPPTHH